METSFTKVLSLDHAPRYSARTNDLISRDIHYDGVVTETHSHPTGILERNGDFVKKKLIYVYMLF